MWYLRPEHLAGLLVGAVCVIVSALLLGYAARGLPYAVAGVAGVFIALVGWGAVRMVTDDLGHWRGP